MYKCKVLNNILLDKSKNREGGCEVCGKEKKELVPRMVPLWNYGVREVKERWICKSCASALKKGEL